MSRTRREVQDWRRFELMVAKLEAVLRPTRCVFRSPDHLIDHETGDSREVDCSITFAEADGPRISIECRKRGTKEDVTWIEQLATKKNALRLTETIAVSSRGFSASAYRKAKHHGITLNTYREIHLALADRPLTIAHTRTNWSLRGLTYEIDDSDHQPDAAQIATVDQRVNNATRDTPVLRVIASHVQLSLGALIDHVLDRAAPSLRSESRRKFELRFPEPTTLVDLADTMPLSVMRLEVEEHKDVHAVVEPGFGTYSGLGGVLLQVATARLPNWQLEVLFRVLDEEGSNAK